MSKGMMVLLTLTATFWTGSLVLAQGDGDASKPGAAGASANRPANPPLPAVPKIDVPRDIFGGLVIKPNDMDKWHRGKIKSISDDTIVAANQQFKPDALKGKVICPNYDREIRPNLYGFKYYRIVSNTADTIKTRAEDGKLTEFAQVGDTYLLAGFFHIEKIKDRHVMIDPLDHPFIPMGPCSVVDNARGTYMPPQMVKDKYGTRDKWASETLKRIQGLGWTSTMCYGWPSWSQYLVGGGYYHPQLPFAQIVRVADNVSINPKNARGIFDSPIKNILNGVSPRSFMDVFDPRFAKIYAKGMDRPWGPASPNNPWVIAHVTEEGDNLFGLLRKNYSLGYLAMIANPTQGKSSGGVAYSDPKLYTKYAIADFLKKKYGTIDKLNAAWGSKYTTFDSAGGWGKGAGVLDEDGQLGQAWLGSADKGGSETNWQCPNPTVKKNILEFQTMIVDRFYQCEVQGLRDENPDHMVMGFCLDNIEDPADYFAVSKWVDLTYQPAPDSALKIKDLGKNKVAPWCAAFYICAEEDSPMADLYKDPMSWRWPGTYFKTQELRGKEYYDRYVSSFNRISAAGEKTCIGSLWWGWADDTGEKREWGVVTIRDNLYDGKEATRLGADGKSGTWDDEPGNYGDLASWLRAANAQVTKILIDEMAGKAAAAPAAEPSAKRSASEVPDNPMQNK